MMKIGLSEFVRLQCLFLFESQTKEKREGRTRKIQRRFSPCAKEKGSFLWIRQT